MKTRKKVSIALRCPHEIIMAACLEEKLPTVKIKLPVVEEKCKYCLKSFDVSTGGRCMECHNGVFYCSRKCQVTELYIALILSEILN